MITQILSFLKRCQESPVSGEKSEEKPGLTLVLFRYLSTVYPARRPCASETLLRVPTRDYRLLSPRRRSHGTGLELVHV